MNLFEPKRRKQSYVGAYYDSSNDAVIIWERDENGKRVVKPYQAPHYFYVPDEDGEYTSIFGDKARKVTFDSKDDFNDALRQYRERFESDISPLFRVLMDEYYEADIPRVHYALLDIEVDYSASAGCGFSSPENPYAEINAVTIWQSWTKKYITVALLPKRLRKRFNRAKFDKYVADIAATHGLYAVPDVQIAANEGELLDAIVDAIEDADIISGWNSEFFDLPYIIKRMERTRPRLVQRMCFPGCRPPREKTVERFGTPSIVYSLNGRTHLDYLDLFKKFTFEGRTSYSLGAITGDELDAPKMEHEGTLEQLFKGEFFPSVDEEWIAWNTIATLRETTLERLTMRRSFVKEEILRRDRAEQGFVGLETYNEDDLLKMYEELDDDVLHCSFATFCCYNTHDVGCLVGLDEKFNFIGLVNQMAHENTVLFENMTGTVRYVETGIANRAHYVHQLIVMDKKVMTDGEKVEGALVLDPLAGLHKWLGSVDITSLYPSVIRSMCISPEKFIAQFSNGEADWRGIRDGDEYDHTCVDDGGDTVTMTGKEWRETLKENGWVLSAYGTIFDQSSGPGIVDATLTFWFAERKRLKKIMDEWKKKQKAVSKEAVMIFSKEDAALIKVKDPSMQEVYDMVATGEFFYQDGHLYDKDQWKLFQEYQVQIELYDLLQLTKKIQLNSCYGALLSAHFRFGRKEMGASVTACGRQITTFMIEQIGEIVSGKKTTVHKRTIVEKDGTVKNSYTTDSDMILLSDTDSCYFLTGADNEEDAVKIADETAEKVNAMFPEFMRTAFFCVKGHDTLIQAGREVVGSAGLFLAAKKKYTIKVVNLDGYKLEAPKLKSMGSEIKKADTPKVIQNFLKQLMDLILDSHPYEVVERFVNKQRGLLIRGVKNPISLGVAKQVNNLDAKYAEWTRVEKAGKGKVALPGHVRAAINYNEMAQLYQGGDATLLKAGDKGMIFYLAPNDHGLATIAFPADITAFPQWFTDNFKLNRKLTEEKMIDAKLQRIFDTMDWDIPTPQRTMVKSILKF